MGTSLVTAATSEPISVDDARAQCRVSFDADDDVLSGLILSAREWAQGFTGRTFMAQTWDYFLDEFPSEIRLPFSPVQSITSISYVDPAGATQVLSAAAYEADVKSAFPRVRPASGYSWPSVKTAYNSVTVRLVAGYTANHPDLASVRAAMLLHVEAHYDRDERSFDTIIAAAEALLSPLKIVRF